jgi:class 3 adenylate cyclase
MSKEGAAKIPAQWRLGESGPLHVSVLFVDLVSSSDFASVMSLQGYAQYVSAFHDLCRRQTKLFFQTLSKTEHLDYSIQMVGDEMVAFLHTESPANDVYLLTCLAVTLKCGWLGSPLNAERLSSGLSSTGLASGINSGLVWASKTSEGFTKCGFALNVGKRVESASRDGERYQVMVSDPAFKQINRRIRNLLFEPRRIVPMKGIVVPVGVHEVAECFINIGKRLEPDLLQGFEKVARQALQRNTFDLWVHSCWQLYQASVAGDLISDDALSLCEHVLNIDPLNPVALYHAGQAMVERKDLATAALYYEDLTGHWPSLADGWLELARVYEAMGRTDHARTCILQARRRGVPKQEPASQPSQQ